MKRTLLSLIFTFTFSSIYSQDTITYFSDALKENIESYNIASNNAYEKRDISEGRRLFDSLVKYKLVGTQFDNFNIKSYKAKNVKLNTINKPVFIITYSSWCVINKGEIPALNILAKEHRDEMQIIVLFWDKKANLKKIANQFCSDIKVCYANESYSDDSHIISTIKHTLGFPTSIFIDENKKVVSIKHFTNIIKLRTPVKEAIVISYNNFSTSINESLVNTLANNYSLSNN